jgi:endonuclease YncB( thermonuclease family)
MSMSDGELVLRGPLRSGPLQANAPVEGWLIYERAVDGDTLAGPVFFTVPILEYSIRDDAGRVRIFGVNAPEMQAPTVPAAKEAQAFTANWCLSHTQHDQLYKPQRLCLILRAMDHFGRFVADVGCMQGHDLGSELVSSGHAVAYVFK